MSTYNNPSKQHGNRPQGGRGKDFAKKNFLEQGEEIMKNYFWGLDILKDLSEAKVLDKLIEATEKMVREKGKLLSTNQLRNIYEKVVQAKNLMDIKMIRPQLAYMAGRDTSKEKPTAPFLSFIDMLIRQTTDATMTNFKKFMEMVVAYHKYYSEKD